MKSTADEEIQTRFNSARFTFLIVSTKSKTKTDGYVHIKSHQSIEVGIDSNLEPTANRFHGSLIRETHKFHSNLHAREWYKEEIQNCGCTTFSTWMNAICLVNM